MENCKFGLNDHKPFLRNKEKEHHHSENQHHHHGDSCGHDHSIGGHTHDHRGTDKKVLKWALTITLITMFLEFFYGFLSNSLALISDAIHMFTH